MKVLMHPHLSRFGNDESGIKRVVEAYFKYLPEYGVELVHPDAGDYDILAVHAGSTGKDVTVCHCHGLYWSADYPVERWQRMINDRVIQALRHAKEVTVPSDWVAEAIRRDMRFNPHVVPHGIDWQDWVHNEPLGNYVLWNKNRGSDVCDPNPVLRLAHTFPEMRFVTTFVPRGAPEYSNVEVLGTVIPHDQMKLLVQSALVYLSTTKETFAIGVLEALASGTPVLGFDYGGNSFLIEHGVNGYLAPPGDYEALAEGLVYCVTHRATLGANGRELAKLWTWDKAVQQIAGIYELALQEQEPEVDVVIPFYNKSYEEVKRAINSVLNQTCATNRFGIRIASITVVNDGSNETGTDSVRRAITEFGGEHGGIPLVLVEQNNQGVANARNRGVAEGVSKYVVCLDADDEIEAEFIERCVQQLEKDDSLGVAYTGLVAVHPDGRRAVSRWPPQFDYNKQLRKQNQIPTCSVIRRKAWERVGGQDQTYCGKAGAGAEDAECYLRIGAAGWDAIKVTDKPLFVYHLGGLVSGDPTYSEPDWTDLWPWAGEDGDGQHPFASVATPREFSHDVRQYDEPVVSVIIPVGPGHETQARRALTSLEHQGYRRWEAIVVWDGPGFSENEAVQRTQQAYPYAKYLSWSAYNSDTGRGAGYARNLGALAARSQFLFFLDADDWIYPNCLERMIRGWNETGCIVYPDHVGKAYVEDTSKLDPRLQERIYAYDEDTHEAVIGYRALDYDYDLAVQQPLGERPYLWCNVTTLVPKIWHDEIGGFDEELSTWEDVDYHWRLAKAGHCYQRIPEELMVYQFHTGRRREWGIQSHKDVINYLKHKHERIEIMPCSGCSKRRPAPTVSDPRSTVSQVQSRQVAAKDDNYIKCVYIHPNRGSHPVYGAAGFDQQIAGIPMSRLTDGRWHHNYGHRSGGGQEEFLVHRDDLRLMPAQFVPAQVQAKPEPPPAPRQELPPPATIVPQQQQQEEEVQDSRTEPMTPELARQRVAELLPKAPEKITSPRQVEAILKRDAQKADPPPDPVSELQRLPGIGPAIAQKLVDAGIVNKDMLLALGVEKLALYNGVGEYKAHLIIDSILEQEVPADESA